jgi:hypothetical protein
LLPMQSLKFLDVIHSHLFMIGWFVHSCIISSDSLQDPKHSQTWSPILDPKTGVPQKKCCPTRIFQWVVINRSGIIQNWSPPDSSTPIICTSND